MNSVDESDSFGVAGNREKIEVVMKIFDVNFSEVI